MASFYFSLRVNLLKIPCGKPQGILMQGIIFYHIRSLDPVATAGNTLAIHLSLPHIFDIFMN